jgi:benzoate membrane transport protein
LVTLGAGALRHWLPALGTAVPLIILFIAALTIPLAAAQQMNLSEQETTSWLLALYGLPGLLSLVLAFRYRQPLLLTGNVAVLIYVASLGKHLSYPEIVGASMVAGAGVLSVSALGLTGRLATWIPAPIVFGLLAGAIIPFVTGIFTPFRDAPVLVGGMLLAFLLGQRILGKRLPAILPALVAGVAIVALTGQLGRVPPGFPLPLPAITGPVFSVHAIATATPVLVVLITLQSNVPSMVFLQNQGYRPPERVINIASGVGTSLASLLGPTAFSISFPATALAAGADAGPFRFRHRSVYLASGVAIVIGLLAGLAADLPRIVPSRLLLVLAGLAVISVLSNALQQMSRGPLLLGPLFAFAISLSDISILGFGPFFWALVLGTSVSLLLERDELKILRSPVSK